jgi:hypothetical protein
MQSTARLGALLLGIGSVLMFVSCGDGDDNGGGGAGQSSDAGQSNEGGTGHVDPGPNEGGADTGGVAHGGGSHSEAPTICRVLGELCHEADTGTGPASECHELGHIGDDTVCAQEFDSCIATCVDTGGGEGGAGGGASSTLDPYCAALGSLCHPVDLGSGMGADCHEIGHLNVAADCADAFESCGSFCLEELEKLEGAGGAGPAAGGAGGNN